MPPTPTGHAAFAAYLRRHRSSVFHLLADFAEEGFQYEVIPFVRGGDRTALVHRKLNQFFYGSTLATALSLGREGRVGDATNACCSPPSPGHRCSIHG